MFNPRDIATAAVAAMTFTLATGATAQVNEHTFRLGFQTSLETAYGRSAQFLAEKVSELSDGKMNVEIFPQGQLGGDVQILSSVRGGTIEMFSVSTALLTTLVPDFSLFDLPFLFNDESEAEAIFEGPFGEHLSEKLEEAGLVTMYYSGSGFRNLTNSARPVRTVEDVAGLKIRVLQNPVYVDTWKALGANPVPLPFPELYTALEQGTVEGQENPYGAIVAANLFEVQDYLSYTRHVYFVGLSLFSKKVWDGLTADEQAVLTDAHNQAYDYYKSQLEAENEEFAALLGEQMELNELDEGALDGFRTAVQPVVDEYSQSASPEAFQILNDELAKIRGN